MYAHLPLLPQTLDNTNQPDDLTIPSLDKQMVELAAFGTNLFISFPHTIPPGLPYTITYFLLDLFDQPS